ncbi:hypothetical protein ACFLYR_07885 [Chloroflexota bacterium]
MAGRHIEIVSQANAVSAKRIPELPEGVKYMVLRKRIIKRPQRKKRAEKRMVKFGLRLKDYLERRQQ